MTETIDLESLVPYIVVTGIHWESFVVPETPFLEVLFIMLECLLGLGVDPAIKNTHTHTHVPCALSGSIDPSGGSPLVLHLIHPSPTDAVDESDHVRTPRRPTQRRRGLTTKRGGW